MRLQLQKLREARGISQRLYVLEVGILRQPLPARERGVGGERTLEVLGDEEGWPLRAADVADRPILQNCDAAPRLGKRTGPLGDEQRQDGGERRGIEVFGLQVIPQLEKLRTFGGGELRKCQRVLSEEPGGQGDDAAGG